MAKTYINYPNIIHIFYLLKWVNNGEIYLICFKMSSTTITHKAAELAGCEQG